jgi:glycosyltransferase involved in cell wall biosynthesis
MLRVFTNIPNPYNGHLYRALRKTGLPVKVVYRSEPTAYGRPWSIPLDPDEVIAGGFPAEWRELRAARGSVVILSGGYLSATEMFRRISAPRLTPDVWYWGERLSPRWALLPYRRWYLSGCEGVYAVGTWARSGYRRLLSKDQPVHVLPYTTAVRRTRRQPSDHPVIGYAGSLIHRKGVDILLEGLASLPTGRRPRLEVVGSGPMRERLESSASDAGLRVDWLGEMGPGPLDERRATWWAQAVPSRYDGWGVVVSEAMASGVPVIAAAQVGAGRDLVRRGYNGTLVTEARDWPSAIRRYCDDRVVVRESARARVVGEEFSSEKAAAWLIDTIGHRESRVERNFVDDGWRRTRVRLPT